VYLFFLTNKNFKNLKIYFFKKMEKNLQNENEKKISENEDTLKKSYYPELQEKIAELEAVNTNLQTIFDNTSDGIVIHNRFGKILSVNNRAAEMFNIGKTLENDTQIVDFYTKDIHLSELLSIWEEVLQGKKFSIEIEIRQFETKKRLFVHISHNKAYWFGKEVIVAVLTDFTQRKKYEDELIKAKAKAEESDKLKTEFLRNISHEIRTPMNGIIGFANLLKRTDIGDKERTNFLGFILRSTYRLMKIIDDILEISKLGTKQVDVKETEVNLLELFIELYTLFIDKAKEKNINLTYKNELNNKKCIVFSDKPKLQRIVGNLLENALRFTQKGSVEYGCLLKNDKIEIYVKDTGIGIAQEQQQIIFERFSQADKGLTRRIGGLGLGLSIARENAFLLGGDIYLKSEKGQGATFFVTLPYKPVISQEEIDAMKEIDVPKKECYTILIVEDEEENSFYLETLFKIKFKMPYEIIVVENGKQAIDICKQNKSIDMILLDLKMPIIDGFEAAERIKEMRPELPIIVQSAYASKENKAHAAIVGCNDFIAKPISLETFSMIIEKYLA